jgi:DNA replication protein DnaC
MSRAWPNWNLLSNANLCLLLGKTGTGKTHLATAFGIRACEAGLRVQFATLQELLSKLYATLADETTTTAMDNPCHVVVSL